MKYLAIIFFLFSPLVLADDDHPGQGGGHHDGGTLTGGDAIIGDIVGGSNSYSSDALGLGFSYALGDVDLNEGRNCYVSVANGNILWGRQKVKLNPWCAALFYDANRKHMRAATMRCSINSIASTHPYYGDLKKCREGETLAPGEIVRTPDVEEVRAMFQEFEDEREVLVEEIRQELEQQNKRVEKLSTQRVAPPQVYIDEGAQRRAAAKAALQGEKK